MSKGLYKRALAGKLQNFTGISDPYEAPCAPELAIDSSQELPHQSAQRVLAELHELELFRDDEPFVSSLT